MFDQVNDLYLIPKSEDFQRREKHVLKMQALLMEEAKEPYPANHLYQELGRLFPWNKAMKKMQLYAACIMAAARVDPDT